MGVAARYAEQERARRIAEAALECGFVYVGEAFVAPSGEDFYVEPQEGAAYTTTAAKLGALEGEVRDGDLVVAPQRVEDHGAGVTLHIHDSATAEDGAVVDLCYRPDADRWGVRVRTARGGIRSITSRQGERRARHIFRYTLREHGGE